MTPAKAIRVGHGDHLKRQSNHIFHYLGAYFSGLTVHYTLYELRPSIELEIEV